MCLCGTSSVLLSHLNGMMSSVSTLVFSLDALSCAYFQTSHSLLHNILCAVPFQSADYGGKYDTR